MLIDVIINLLIPRLKCQLFLADILRMTAELSKAFMLHCLDCSCSTTSTLRTKVLMDMLSTTTPLRRMIEYRGLIGDFPEYLLQIRMDSIVKLEWEILDPFLVKFFATEEMPFSKAVVHTVLYRLQLRGTGDKTQQVCNTDYNRRYVLMSIEEVLWSYLRNVVPRMDNQSRELMMEDVKTMNESPERNILLKELTPNNIPPPTIIPNAIHGRLTTPPHIWRQRLQVLVAEIIAPDALSWMDDDEELAPALLCRRALYDIQSRYEQYVFPVFLFLNYLILLS
jgi:serine/threonine-protein kinase ATR